MAASSEPSTLRGQLQGMDDYPFEHFVAELWERQGWSTTVSKQSNDAGIDIIAERSDPATIRQVIQVKRYDAGNKVGGPEIQQYASLDRQVDGASSVVVVTSGEFTSSAGARASEHGVELIDGRDLEQLIEELDGFDLIEKYADEPPVLKTSRRASAAAETGSVAVSSLGGLLAYVARHPDEAVERVVGLLVLVIILYVFVQVLSTLMNINLPF